MLWERSYDPSNPQAGFSALVAAWENDTDKVFVLRADGPVMDVRQMLSENFSYLGRPVPLAEDVGKGDRDSQRSGEIWFEVRYDPKHPDAYRHSANAQPFHTDGSYIPDFPNATIMACVANAGEGGETIFVDANDLVDVLAAEAPRLLDDLRNFAMPHARSGDERTEKVIDELAGKTLVNWNYYCIEPTGSELAQDLADEFFAYLLNSPKLRDETREVKLSPGDLIAWKDREVLHGRNAFKATEESQRFLWKCAIDIGNFDG
jgi:alpha-ketoglutarate-dependent taurine dioxygenase